MTDGPRTSPPRELERLIAGRDLERGDMRTLIGKIMDGEVTDAQKAGLLVALAAKGETADEIAGAAEAMRRRCVLVEHRVEGVVDTCGTGGDRSGTFNISTAAAFVAAGADVPIAKHGNRSVSSRSGSADVLEAVGIRAEATAENAARALEEIGICFLFAPVFHPAMREVMPVRRELGVRTIFNILGPLTNPAGARRQVIGVFARELVEVVARVLVELGSEHALVVHGADGLDELTTTGTTHVAEVVAGEVTLRGVVPGELGLEPAAPEDLVGGEPEENGRQLLAVLAGEAGPLADITALNAAAAIYVGGRAASLREGLATARRALASGAALERLERLRHFQANGAS